MPEEDSEALPGDEGTTTRGAAVAAVATTGGPPPSPPRLSPMRRSSLRLLFVFSMMDDRSESQSLYDALMVAACSSLFPSCCFSYWSPPSFLVATRPFSMLRGGGNLRG